MTLYARGVLRIFRDVCERIIALTHIFPIFRRKLMAGITGFLVRERLVRKV
jgi:hypothetical protein